MVPCLGLYTTMNTKHAISHHAAYKNPSEDRISTLETKKGYKLYSVFDGHSGQGCVELVYKMLPIRIVSALDEKDTETPEKIGIILQEEFCAMETNCNESLSPWDGGTTAVISVVTDTHIITAHIGDSPALLMSKKGELLKSTADHDAKNTAEVERVMKEGGWFSKENPYGEPRLFNALSVTRCFGNIHKKSFEKGLNAIPDIMIWERTPETYLILCSDSFTEEIGDITTGECDKEGNPVKIIANRGSHQDIINEIYAILVEFEYDIEHTATMAVHRRTMRFYNWQWGKYCGDNTSLILVALE